MSNSCSSDDDTYLSRLFSLIQNSLPNPFNELGLISLTKEKEKELLISLSQILNLIRRWTDDEEQDCCSIRSSNGSSDLHSNDIEFLNKIVANLILLLNAKSQYVRHTVGNIFLAISEFLLAYGGSWDRFIHSLCVCFEFEKCNSLQYFPQPLMMEADDPKSIVSNLILVSSTSTWNGIAEILRILRGVVKLLKDKDDAELVGVLLNALSNCLMKAPWDLVDGIVCNCSTEAGGSSGEAETKILVLGNLIQLLCSIVGLIGFAKGVGSHCESAILTDACELVPRLLGWCHCGQWSNILPYIQYKILMLMVKLSFHMKRGCLTLSLWLQLLHEHYQDLLSSPISHLACGQNDTLEGSPFLLSFDDQELSCQSSCHLQRKAVFLFLRCCLSLVNLRKTADFKCTCTNHNSIFESELVTVKYCFSEKKGLSKFYEWLQGHVPSNMFSESDINLDQCINFASSFIRFYVQEDDMLFEVLLLMFAIPSWAERLFSKDGRDCLAKEEDILFHISNLLNPLLLFHVFLSELQYDHQLLLDYLISKDIGGKCAEYLLKCLRTVCDSWELFIGYSLRENLVCQNTHQRSCKRRRAHHDDSSEVGTDTPLQSGLALSSEKPQENCKLESMFQGTRCLQFEGVKACMLSLKCALRKLHGRKLFPYNPEVLIRRLTRFEELCDRHV